METIQVVLDGKLLKAADIAAKVPLHEAIALGVGHPHVVIVHAGDDARAPHLVEGGQGPFQVDDLRGHGASLLATGGPELDQPASAAVVGNQGARCISKADMSPS